MAFKVKTTNPERYLVRPNQGVLGAHTENLEVRGTAVESISCAWCVLAEFHRVSAPVASFTVVVMGEPLDALLKEVESHAGEDYFPAYVAEVRLQGSC